jgi:putative ABC transport system substrate-binding protein
MRVLSCDGPLVCPPPRAEEEAQRKKMKNKITFLTLGAMFFALCGSVDAQQPGKVFRIGFLDPSTAAGNAVLVDAFRQEMGKLGWIEGKNYVIEYRFAEQRNERLPELAADLVRLKVDLSVVTGTTPARAAKKATTTIPITMTSAADPVAAGLVVSLARPGGNVTGFASLRVALNTKRLEILKDAVPRLIRVAVLRLPAKSEAGQLQLKERRPAALALKLTLEEIETRANPKDLESAFQTAKQKQVGAIMTTATTSFFAERKRIVELGVKYGLPAIYPQKEFVEGGGLMSYGVDYTDLYRGAAV